MRSMSTRSRVAPLFTVSALALMTPAALHAQATVPAATGPQANPNDSVSEDTDDQGQGGDEIIVTGFRQALESAVAEKRDRDLVVESITAEDIGKLPDASIAESIARLPGLTSQRVSGRSNAISIRGFAPDFSTTLLNGREQTSTGDNRAVEYDQYPSEVVNQVLVYKTAQASLIGQGLSGTVDLRTIRPIDYGRSVVSVGARGTYADLGKLNSGSEELGYRVNATYIDQFANDTIGVALSAAYLNEPYQIQEFNAWGYATTAAGDSVIGGSKSYVTSTTLQRLGLQGTLQFRPVPELTMTLDGFYSDFNDDQIKRGIELPLGFGANGTSLLTSTTVENGLVTSGTFQGVEGVVRNDSFERKAKLYSFGYNTRYEGDDGWNVQLDLSFSRTDRQEIIIETYAGTGYGPGNGATDNIGFTTGPEGTVFSPTLDYSDPNLILLTDPLGWGGATRQAGYFNNRDVEDEIRQYRLEVEKELSSPLSAVRFGLNYTDRSKDLTPIQFFLTLANGALQQQIPAEFIQRPTNLSYLGLGPMLSYDPRDLIAAGTYAQVPNLSNDVISSAFRIEEDIMTAYLQGDISQPIGASELTGNIGLQAVFTEQKSSGLVFNGTSFSDITRGDDYVDVLPSLNLSLRLPIDLVIRLGAARQMQRPRLDDMRVALGYGYNTQEGIITGGGGNPFLRPIRSNSFDLTIEKYFGTRGYIAAQGFYKDLKSFVYNLETPFDFTGFPLPPTAPPGTPTLGRNNQPINGDGGSIYGAELAATLQLGDFTSALEGFGVTGGASYTETEIQPTPGGEPEDIPGYSRWVANGTAFFERWGFNVRGSVRYRSTFVGELSGFGAARTRRRAIDETIVDAQIGYDFRSGALNGLSVFLQGQNLTDEPFATINGDARDQVIDYQTYGRRFLAGASFRF
ncbi:iron complex outermembrane receptor protein [Sphingomonas jejuensis]|uniref:Iron complex outermembrane receptor protein n=2 Tax=Sphingomonas jejuensis TaxID=904715 RepID=A0ABX0XM25_9SPHN|nr:TonB-dependent receptor [Sphingomonas jejuensis]NJC34424.1 iron complex outermembrane receptor protein [Sphingomonas jejuensis]